MARKSIRLPPLDLLFGNNDINYIRIVFPEEVEIEPKPLLNKEKYEKRKISEMINIEVTGNLFLRLIRYFGIFNLKHPLSKRLNMPKYEKENLCELIKRIKNNNSSNENIDIAIKKIIKTFLEGKLI